MAEYKNVYEGISKILECGICMNHLHKPKVLHCQHSFCRDCIDNILKFNADGSAEIICPFRCAGCTIIPADQTVGQLGVNYQLLGIVDMYKQTCNEPKSETGRYLCRACEDEDDVSIYCSECYDFYCAKCERDHQNHSSVKIAYNESYGQHMPLCKEHDALGNFICCKQIICIYCQKRKHNGHQFENLKTHATRIKQLFFNQDGSGGKIDKVMQNAKKNYDGTVAALAGTKKSLVNTLKNRMLASISNHISLVEKEAVRLVEQLDKEICLHMQYYPDVTPSDFLKTVTERDDVELVVKRDHVLKEYSRYTTRVPTLHISLTDAAESPKEFPLGNLKIEHGEYVSISGDDNILRTTHCTLPLNSDVLDVTAVVNKLEGLMKETNLKEGKLSSSMPRYSETKHFSKLRPTAAPPVQEALSLLDIKGYEYIEELFVTKKEQLLMDLVIARNDIASMKDNTGVTILHSAAQHGFAKLLGYLLESQLVDVNTTQRFRQTALHYAAYHNKVPCVELLLQYNADTNLRNHKGSRPIDVAIQYKSADVLPLLQQTNA